MSTTPTTSAVREPASAVTERFRVVVCCLLLVALAFSQRPGRLVSDTKLDLVVDPGGMLGRALHLWDPTGGFGQVQNQAYGYLWPLGPFYWLGDLASVPGWAIQRLWWALLLVVAFLGVVLLCRALGTTATWAVITGGFAYALSPRILTTIGPISIEAWPSALAPWVLLPLVVGCQRGSPRRAAALSALAVAAVGGVNAAATFAVLPLGVVWLLTREPGPRRRSLMTWWPVFVAIGTAWWVVPLLVLGRYSPPFLDYIESASVTTLPTTPFDVLRGTSHWVAYVDPLWQAGNDLLSNGYGVLNSGVLLLLGVVGLMLRDNPHRQFLVLGTLLGVLLVSFGHVGSTAGWFAATGQNALDGVLAPFRNVHKLDPVVRLPLVLGLVHVVARASVTARAVTAPGTALRGRFAAAVENGGRVAAVGVLVLSTVGVAGAAGPALAGRLSPADDFESVPGYWGRAVAWLDEHHADEATTALLVPGSSFATYVWGTPEDEPAQALSAPRWAVRNAVPLAPAGNIRMLDGLEEQLSSGQPSAGLARYLGRAGVEFLVVRNDLRGSTDVPPPVLVHQALDGSPGLTRVADFGPDVGGPVRIDEDDRPRAVAEGGWHSEYPAVEIYQVAGAEPAASTPAPPVVVGGPEDLLGLLDAGLLGDEPSVLAADVSSGPAPGARLLLTDGLRRREATFARVHDNRSATLSAGDDGRRGAPARDHLLAGSEEWETTAELVGARQIDASSSRAFADTSGPVRPETQPYAAFDGRQDTVWASGPPGDSPAWVRLELDDPRSIDRVTVVAGDDVDDDELQRVRVVTEAGRSDVLVLAPGRPVTTALPQGESSWLRVEGVDGSGDLVLAEVQVPGIEVARTLVLPEVPAAWGAPDGVLLTTDPVRDDCVRVDGDVRCDPGRASGDEGGGVVDRTVRLGTGATYGVSATVRPVLGDALLGLIQQGQFANVTASTTGVDDPRGSAVAAVDGDPGTTWTAEEDDAQPTLGLSWIGERRITGLRLSLDRQAPAAPPRRVEVVWPGGRQRVTLGARGAAELRPLRATQLQVRVLGSDPAVSRGAGGTRRLAVGVSEVRLDGLELLPLRLAEAPVDVGCGFGPPLRIGDQLYATSVTASPRQLFDNEPVAARVCAAGDVDVPAGSTRVVMTPAPAFRPTSVAMVRPGAGADATPWAPVTFSQTSAVGATLDVGPAEDPRVVAVRMNANAGWAGRLDGGEVAPGTVVDGWQQAWWVPPDAGSVDITFTPDRAYRIALLVGGLLLVGLAVGVAGRSAVVGRRRPSRDEEPAAVAARDLPSGVLSVAGLLACGVVAGWPGLGCGALGLVASRIARARLDDEVVAWAAGLPVVAAALVYWARPLGSADGWAGAMVLPQLLVLVTLGALVGSLGSAGRGARDHGAGRWRSRIVGRSTTR